MSKPRVPQDLQLWIDARKRFGLSHAHVQMARELGIGPKALGGLANHRQEAWKIPLPEFIAREDERRFGRASPERVVSIEERAQEVAAKKSARKAARAAARQAAASGAGEA